jgi:ribose transport system ATP-binding protein
MQSSQPQTQNAPLNPSEPVLLRFERVSKQFGGTLAVDDLTLEVRAGEVLALLGQNGAGKSTVIKMLAGVHPSSSGEILYRNQKLESFNGKAPIAFIHQDLGLIEWMTVAENLSLGVGFPKRRGLIDWRSANTKASRALDAVGGGISPSARIFSLSRTERALVAIARALAQDVELLVLDEPTSSLPAADVERLFEVLRFLRKRGVGIIYVSHRLDEVFKICDRIAVMRDGRLVSLCETRDTNPSELVTTIVGHKIAEAYPKAKDPSQPQALLEVKGLRVATLEAMDFRIRPGEVLGLTGLKGAGQVEIGRSLFGLESQLAGQVSILGNSVSTHSPLESMKAGIGFVSSNRREESLAMTLSVRENFFMNPANRGQALHQTIQPKLEKSEAKSWISRFNVRPPDAEQTLETLSGGNQQKVVMGRWLEFGAKLLILEEPTLGVDVGSKAEIYGFLVKALEAGAAVLLVSTDLEEIAGICHRALVFNRGRVAAELEGSSLNVAELVHAAAGEAPAIPPNQNSSQPQVRG